MELLVRPFYKIVERGAESAPSEGTGRIAGTLYRFAVDGAEFDIPVLRRGNDAYGEFAIVEESCRELPGGFRLAVELDPPSSPDEDPGCTIRLYKPHRDHARLQAENPGTNLLLPVEADISVDFDPWGQVDGS